MVSQVREVREEGIDLVLQRGDMRIHPLEFPDDVSICSKKEVEGGVLALLEVIAAIRRILAFEVQVAASLTRCLSVAFDLAALTFVTVKRSVSGETASFCTYHAIEI